MTIVSIDSAGKHNAAFEGSRARILEGASWKHQRVIVLIPASDTISTKVALSHWNIIFPPNNPVFRMLCLGMEVADAYNQAIEQVLAEPTLSTWEYFLTVEHDNVIPPDGVLQLIESMDKNPKLSAISGLYWTKGEGGVPQIWGDINDPVVNYRPQPPLPDQVQECYGIGMGFALWRIRMFANKKLRRPWFKTSASVTEGVGTQDLYFAADARKHGYRFAVDTRVKVGHLDLRTGIVW
jgi:hypothetical protein